MATKNAKPLPKSKVIDGKRYTKTACSKSKAAAKANAKKLRAEGKNARVLKDTARGTYCVFSKGRKKSK